MYYRSDVLKHHGILGMRWGRRNGPPYPIDAEDHSVSEKRAGWRKSLSGQSSVKTSRKRRHLSYGQKKAIAIGVGLAVAGLAVYGQYKNGNLDLDPGKNAVSKLFGDKIGNTPLSDIRSSNPQPTNRSRPLRIKESLLDSVIHANPHLDEAGGEENCTSCSVAGILRTLGHDVKAKPMPEGTNLNGVIEKVFKIPRNQYGQSPNIFDGRAVTFAKSMDSAKEMLKKRFGDNAKGVCGIQWLGQGNKGHAFSWVIDNGEVRFIDFQSGSRSQEVIGRYWKQINPNGILQLARLDNLEIDYEALRDVVEF